MLKLAASQIRLASRARVTARTIYASLPFEYRFGVMLEIFSDSYAGIKDMMARTIYAEFLKAGVPGMSIDGQPGEELQDKAKKMGHSAWKLIPRGYGAKFARTILGMVRNKLKTEDSAQDFIGELMMMLVDGSLKISGSAAGNLKGAESYTLTFISRRLIDFLRSQGRSQKHEVPLDPGGSDDDDKPRYEVEDPSSLSGIIRRLSPGEERKMLTEIKRIDPRNPDRPAQYIQYKLEHYTNQEIANEWWPHQRVNKGSMADWTKKYVPLIKKVMDKYVWTLSDAV